MTDAEGQQLFRFATEAMTENEALKAEAARLRYELEVISVTLRRLAARAARAISPTP
jgi:hypothetical protein